MTRRLTGVSTYLAMALVLALSFLPAAAQLSDADILDMLKDLSPEEREELLREFGIAPADVPTIDEPDVSTPEVVGPRELETSAVEDAVAGEAVEMDVEDGPAPTPIEPFTEETVDIRRAFENFIAESQPLEIDRDLKQFGYELFAGAPTTFAPATDIPVSADYIIGPGDEVRVQLYGKTNQGFTLLVDREGIVSFPDLGPISVAGMTFVEMKEHLSNEIENRMIGVSGSISMGQLRSIRVFVLGDVFQPGSYTVSGLSTLTNALFVSGGVLKTGSLRHVQLKRDGEVVKEMDLYDLLLKGDTSDDARLMPGDVIFVPTVGPLAGVAGEVLRPAIYEMKGSTTAGDLIEIAGGLRPGAHRDLLQVERVDGGQRATFDMTLDELSGMKLADGDLVMVYPMAAGDDVAVFLEGNVVRPGRRQYSEGMRIRDLIPSADALLPETFFDYGLIERENELNREPEYLSFDLGAALEDSLPEANPPLAPRDRVYVFHRAHFREVPRVSVRGEVREPGSYEYKKDMRVLDLVLAAGGLTRDAWLDEAELFRTEPGSRNVDRLSVRLSDVLAADPEDNLILQDMDELAVHSLWEFREEHTVEVLGEVNEPGTYPLSRGMRISDLIFAGGNLRETAYTLAAELTRYEVVGDERRELRHVVVDLRSVLAGDEAADLTLAPYDRLLIRRITNWRRDEVVTVSGEVAFPGSYPIEEGERLSDLIERFGGFLEDAYLPAAVFRRTDIMTLQAEHFQKMADQLEADLARLAVPTQKGMTAAEAAQRELALESGTRLAEELRESMATGRMVIRLGTAEKLRGTEYDLVLTDGDRLHVPKKPDYVTVMGQVNNPTAFQYEKRKRAAYFVRLAGGLTEFGDGGKIHVVKANGSVKMGRAARIDPGDVIVVPESLSRFDGMQFLLDLSQVLYQIGLAAAGAHTVGVID